MYLPKFELEKPESFEEAAALLRVQEGGHLVAGGTELFPRMKYGLCTPEIIVSLKGPRVSDPRVTAEGVLILDARMSLTSVTEAPLIHEKTPLLAMAAARVATREIRNMGTLGGNLCQETRCLYFNQKHTYQFRDPCFKRGGDVCYFAPKGKKCWAVFMSDLAPALLCLDAKLRVVGDKGNREMMIDDLYSHDPLRPIALNRDEIVKEILIPDNGGPRGSGFAKFAMRGGIEFAGLNVAALLRFEKDSATCREARITVGAVSAGPQRVPAAEALLMGRPLSHKVLADASESVAEAVKIFPHHGYSKAYLKGCLKVEAKMALADAKKAVRGTT